MKKKMRNVGLREAIDTFLADVNSDPWRLGVYTSTYDERMGVKTITLTIKIENLEEEQL